MCFSQLWSVAPEPFYTLVCVHLICGRSSRQGLHFLWFCAVGCQMQAVCCYFSMLLACLLDFGAEMTRGGDGKALLLLLNNSLRRWASPGMGMGFPGFAKPTSSSNLLLCLEPECL